MLQMADEFCFDGLLSPEDDVFLNDILGNPPIQVPDPSQSLPPVPAPQQMRKPSLQCPAGCLELFSRPFHVKRHWITKHERLVKKFRCIIDGCNLDYIRADELKSHIAKAHREAFLSGTDRDMQCRSLREVLVPNDRYIDPEGAVAPRGVDVEAELKVSRNARVLAIPAVHPTLHKARAAAQRQVLATMQQQVLPVRPPPPAALGAPPTAPALAQPPSTVGVLERPIPTSVSGLKIEWNRIMHQMHVLQLRKKALEKALTASMDEENQDLRKRLDQAERRIHLHDHRAKPY